MISKHQKKESSNQRMKYCKKIEQIKINKMKLMKEMKKQIC